MSLEGITVDQALTLREHKLALLQAMQDALPGYVTKKYTSQYERETSTVEIADFISWARENL